MATVRGIKKRGADLLNKLAYTIYDPDVMKYSEIFDIGKEELGGNGKRALIIYVVNGVRAYLNDDVENFSLFHYHSMWRESIEMVRALIEHNYIVDYFDVYTNHNIDWQKYDLVIDERNNLTNSPHVNGQVKISYATGCYWMNHNNAELSRTSQFYKRNKILVPPVRQLKPNFSDLFGDYLTYFGNDDQLKGFSESIARHQLNISAHVPRPKKKNIDTCRNKFLWIGSGGLILKGLDLAVEAFMEMPDKELFIAGNLSHEPMFLHWCEEVISKHKNIHYLGWMDVTSQEFKQMADNCIGAVYPGSSEGGAGSVVQAMHFGMIPITTAESNLRGNYVGKVINARQDVEIINGVVEAVNEVCSLSDTELLALSQKAREFALDTFTIEKYIESFNNLIRKIK